MINFLSQNIISLIDLKMEHDSVCSNFEVKEFDMLKVIHQAFNIVRVEANEKKINLMAKIG